MALSACARCFVSDRPVRKSCVTVNHMLAILAYMLLARGIDQTDVQVGGSSFPLSLSLFLPISLSLCCSVPLSLPLSLSVGRERRACPLRCINRKTEYGLFMMLQLQSSSNDTCLDVTRALARAYARVRIDTYVCVRYYMYG